MNGLNPRKYVQWLLEEMPNAENPDDPAYLDSLMPWPQSVPAEVRLKPKAARMANDPIIDGLPRRRGIAETSRSFLDRNGKTPRGLSFCAVILALTQNQESLKREAHLEKMRRYLQQHCPIIHSRLVVNVPLFRE